MTVGVVIIALILISIPLGSVISDHLHSVSRDYEQHNNPFGRRLP